MDPTFLEELTYPALTMLTCIVVEMFVPEMTLEEVGVRRSDKLLTIARIMGNFNLSIEQLQRWYRNRESKGSVGSDPATWSDVSMVISGPAPQERSPVTDPGRKRKSDQRQDAMIASTAASKTAPVPKKQLQMKRQGTKPPLMPKPPPGPPPQLRAKLQPSAAAKAKTKAATPRASAHASSKPPTGGQASRQARRREAEQERGRDRRSDDRERGRSRSQRGRSET